MLHIVWFKRDLRILDHQPLVKAAKAGKCLPLYILEPALWQQADISGRQYHFLCECLTELNQQLTALGQPLVIKVGDAPDVLAELHQQHSISSIHSHQETWNDWTYQRDKQVLSWSKQNHIAWHEYQQNGVIRRLKSRDGWAKRWREQMSQIILEPPKSLATLPITSDALPTEQQLLDWIDPCPKRQRGGRSRALRILNSFLQQRGRAYTYEMSAPTTAFQSCSRLSPYIAFGCVSIREIYQATKAQQLQIKQQPKSQQSDWLAEFSYARHADQLC